MHAAPLYGPAGGNAACMLCVSIDASAMLTSACIAVATRSNRPHLLGPLPVDATSKQKQMTYLLPKSAEDARNRSAPAGGARQLLDFRLLFLGRALNSRSAPAQVRLDAARVDAKPQCLLVSDTSLRVKQAGPFLGTQWHWGHRPPPPAVRGSLLNDLKHAHAGVGLLANGRRCRVVRARLCCGIRCRPCTQTHLQSGLPTSSHQLAVCCLSCPKQQS